MSLVAVSRYVKDLEDAGWISRHEEGCARWCLYESGPVGEAKNWIEIHQRYRAAWLDVLARYPKDRSSE